MTCESNTTRHRRNDRGFTFLEVMISIVLMGTVVVATMAAVRTTIKASSTSRTAAQVETAIVNAVDRVKRAPKTCDYTIYAQAAVQTEDWPPSSASLIQEYYVPGTDATTNGQWMPGVAGAPACASGGRPPDLLVQRVTIVITSPDGSVRRQIQVVKSDV